jgi:hypothetical protein
MSAAAVLGAVTAAGLTTPVTLAADTVSTVEDGGQSASDRAATSNIAAHLRNVVGGAGTDYFGSDDLVEIEPAVETNELY